MKIHVILASFFLPLLLLFVCTGMLYTLGIKGQSHSEKHELESFEFQDENLEQLATQLKPYVHKDFHPLLRQLPRSIKTNDKSKRVTWESPKYSLILDVDMLKGKQTIEIKTKNTLAWLMKLHKAGGFLSFKVITVLLSLSVLLVFISGLYLGLTVPRLMVTTMTSFISGTVVIGLLLWLH